MYRGRGYGHDSHPRSGLGRAGSPAGRGGRGRGSFSRGGPPKAVDRSARRSVLVHTNSFEITRLPSREFYRYDKFIPELKKVEARQQIILKLQNTVAPNVFNPRALYDGNAMLFSSRLLTFDGGRTSGEFRVDSADHRLEKLKPDTRGFYSVTVSLTNSDPIRPSDLDSLIHDGNVTNQSITATNLLQVLISQTPNQNFPQKAKAYFSDVRKLRLGEGLEVWRGFFHSVRPSNGKMLINVDTTMAVVYQGGPLLELATQYMGCNHPTQLDLPSSSHDFRKLEKFLNNLKVLVNTPGSQGRAGKTRTIRGLVANAGNFSFVAQDGKTLTVADYIQSVTQLPLRYRTIVGVRLSPRNAQRTAVVPLEICIVSPGQFFRQKIPDRFTKSVVTFSSLKPGERLDIIMGNGNEPSPIRGYLDSDFLKQTGMEINPQPAQIRGDLLALPTVLFGDNTPAELRNGAWNIQRQRFSKPAPLLCWGIINFSRSIDDRRARNLARDIQTNCEMYGMAVKDPAFYQKGPDYGIDDFLVKIGGMLRKEWNTLAQNPTWFKPFKDAGTPIKPTVIIFLPKLAQELRRKIKYWSDVKTGILTQCLMDDKVKTANLQYWGNVAIKLNARLGGYNSLVNSPAMSGLCEKITIVMGADVSHPGPGSFIPSFASLVASHDHKFSRYMALTSLQTPRRESIEDLKAMVRKAIFNFATINQGKVPERIVFFRDGISEGEFTPVSSFEITEIREGAREAFADVKEEYLKRKVPFNEADFKAPSLTYIVVGKRHHVTFYPQPEADVNDGRGNCIAGFVNDSSDFGNPSTRNFYLQSHAAIQGTSRSALYTVMLDEVFSYNMNHIQDLTFALCHVYSKATRSVSIVAPVYYADLVCARGLNHFEDGSGLTLGSDTASHVSGGQEFDLDKWKESFQAIHNAVENEMYFL